MCHHGLTIAALSFCTPRIGRGRHIGFLSRIVPLKKCSIEKPRNLIYLSEVALPRKPRPYYIRSSHLPTQGHGRVNRSRLVKSGPRPHARYCSVVKASATPAAAKQRFRAAQNSCRCASSMTPESLPHSAA